MQDFWRRWHISLSAWFRDYVYVPLGGNRRGALAMYVNLVTVFFLCGLWHGAAWTFVVWGLFHGAFLVMERVGLAAWIEKMPRVVRHTYVLVAVMVGWVFFRAESLASGAAMLAAMAGFAPGDPTAYPPGWYLTPELMLALVAGAIGSTPIVPVVARYLAPHKGAPYKTKGAPYTTNVQGAPYTTEPASLGWVPSAAVTIALVALLAASLMLMAARTYNPFIYFRF